MPVNFPELVAGDVETVLPPEDVPELELPPEEGEFELLQAVPRSATNPPATTSRVVQRAPITSCLLLIHARGSAPAPTTYYAPTRPAACAIPGTTTLRTGASDPSATIVP